MHDEPDAAGVARAGAAFAARRAELGISQRRLASMKIIGAPNLIAFEKGRSWPREKTLAKLEQVVQWPPGTLAKIRGGGRTHISSATGTSGPDSEVAAVVTGAVTVALNQVLAAADNLPDGHDSAFSEHVREVLAGLRTLESITARAVRSSQGSPEVIKALRSIRHRYAELMARAAAAPDATLGQRLYVARTAAALTTAETAAAMDVAPEVVVAAEAEQLVADYDRVRIEELIRELGG